MVGTVLLSAVMRKFFRYGNLSVIDAGGRRHRICASPGPTVVLRLADAATQWRLLRSDSLAWGEAYMDRRLTIEEGSLAEFLEIFHKSYQSYSRGRLAEFERIVENLLFAAVHFNGIGRSRLNVAHHYDLSGELYDLFLDRDRQYSCAYFPSGKEDLDTAQVKKKRHIAAKLDIRPGMRVLDIGSGWGGMALYLASEFDCGVTGITLSQEQLALSRQRAREAGLDHRIHFELCDYRTLEGRFDRIVSIGMLEHVGPWYYQQYFRRMRDLLEPDGVALIHTIARMGKPQPVDRWLSKYIFPGGYLPALSQLSRAVEASHLWPCDIENLRLHYAQTLQHWYRRFAANRARVEQLYDDRFYRMWELYLLGCESVFRYHRISVLQLQLTRSVGALPISRDYMVDVERELADRERASAVSAVPARRPSASG